MYCATSTCTPVDTAKTRATSDDNLRIREQEDGEPSAFEEVDFPEDSPPATEPEGVMEETQAPVPETPEAAPLLEFKFDEECEMPMVHGIKTCETREQRYARESFEAFGHQYVITKVEQLPLVEVQQKLFKQHGLFSPREFKEVWKHNHSGSFDSEEKVWVHHFSRGFAPPPEPEVEPEEAAE